MRDTPREGLTLTLKVPPNAVPVGPSALGVAVPPAATPPPRLLVGRRGVEEALPPLPVCVGASWVEVDWGCMESVAAAARLPVGVGPSEGEEVGFPAVPLGVRVPPSPTPEVRVAPRGGERVGVGMAVLEEVGEALPVHDPAVVSEGRGVGVLKRVGLGLSDMEVEGEGKRVAWATEVVDHVLRPPKEGVSAEEPLGDALPAAEAVGGTDTVPLPLLAVEADGRVELVGKGEGVGKDDSEGVEVGHRVGVPLPLLQPLEVVVGVAQDVAVVVAVGVGKEEALGLGGVGVAEGLKDGEDEEDSVPPPKGTPTLVGDKEGEGVEDPVESLPVGVGMRGGVK